MLPLHTWLVLAVLASNGNAAVTPKNAGIFPIHRSDGKLSVLLGLDEERNRWTDFVGGIEDESVTDAAIREFHEESRGAFRDDEIRQAVSETKPYAARSARIFIVEVPAVPAEEIEKLPESPLSEKSRYCWVSVAELLASIDTSDRDSATVPKQCGGSEFRLYNVFRDNLAEGGALRESVLGLLREVEGGRPPDRRVQ